MEIDAATFLAGLAAPAAPAAPVDREPVLLPYKPPEQHDAADRAYFDAMQGLRPIWTATVDTPEESVEGVPTGWSAASWRRRLTYLATACESHNPERAAELRRESDRIENAASAPIRSSRAESDAPQCDMRHAARTVGLRHGGKRQT